MQSFDLELRLMEVKARVALAEGRVLRQHDLMRKLDPDSVAATAARAELRGLEEELSERRQEYFTITTRMAEVASAPSRWRD